jgi:hypothetical protein
MSFGFGFGFPRSNSPAGGPTLNFQFAGSTTLNPLITFTRASTSTFFNSAGVLTSAAINAPRFDYNPLTLAAQGLLIEEARTNSIRNNTMVGAANPSTLPTNWGGNSIGLTITIVGTGVQNGVTYIDVRYNGTTTGQFGTLTFEPNNGVAASPSQSWTGSAYISLISGTLANISQVGIGLYYFDSTPVVLSSNAFSAAITATLARYSGTGTTPASTAFVQPGFYFNTTGASGQAVDFTVRIGLPQLEQGAFATSVIPTTTIALTRAADVASVNTLSPWYNAAEGTLYSEATFTNTVSFNTVAALGDGTTSNSMRTIQWNDGTDRIFSIATGGVSQASYLSTGQIGTAKFAGAYKLNDVNASKNGSIGITDTAATIPTVNALWLGATGSSLFLLNGYLRRVAYYPRRLSNAELQAITG